ncbi:hypothetical protein SK571_04445 [Lentzea sp. BCCO 10_0798]|jgi:hypothetical protein|uniref:Uncharacterized protein n=1 Tax=Lentzea kristufekii TaxID=3095430 RepID=A0ABU4TK15_9PSEU|nr:hypothetical protein [Lentzea sp. BCCO 10_0798]MDX8048618.1 hypothetical protein [Lentzea sp. BCCO 10_0798]
MGLVTFEGRDVGFTDALSRVAEQLTPLGAAGRCVAETYALTTEIRRVHEAKAVDDREIRLAVLDQRRRESTATLRGMQKELGRAGKSAAALRECMVNMQRATVRPGLELAERRAYIDLTQHFTTMLVQHHSELTGGVADVIDKVLNGSGAVALAPARRKPRRTR